MHATGIDAIVRAAERRPDPEVPAILRFPTRA
jgi:hypothetical protein